MKAKHNLILLSAGLGECPARIFWRWHCLYGADNPNRFNHGTTRRIK